MALGGLAELAAIGHPEVQALLGQNIKPERHIRQNRVKIGHRREGRNAQRTVLECRSSRN